MVSNSFRVAACLLKSDSRVDQGLFGLENLFLHFVLVFDFLIKIVNK